MLSFGAINMAMMALMKTLDLLGRERRVASSTAHCPPPATYLPTTYGLLLTAYYLLL